MAQLLIISKALAKSNTQSEGDLIGIFEDTHVFSPTELDLFEIRQVPQMTRDELRAYVRQLDCAVLDISEDLTTDTRQKWFDRNTGKWFVLKESPKFTINLKRVTVPVWRNIENGTYTKAQLQQAIETYIDRAIEQIADNFTEEVT